MCILLSVTLTREIKRACNLQVLHHGRPFLTYERILVHGPTYLIDIVLFGHHALHCCLASFLASFLWTLERWADVATGVIHFGGALGREFYSGFAAVELFVVQAADLGCCEPSQGCSLHVLTQIWKLMGLWGSWFELKGLRSNVDLVLKLLVAKRYASWFSRFSIQSYFIVISELRCIPNADAVQVHQSGRGLKSRVLPLAELHTFLQDVRRSNSIEVLDRGTASAGKLHLLRGTHVKITVNVRSWTWMMHIWHRWVQVLFSVVRVNSVKLLVVAQILPLVLVSLSIKFDL